MFAGADPASREIGAAAELRLALGELREEYMVLGVVDRVSDGQYPERLAGDGPHPEPLGDGPSRPVVPEPGEPLR